MKMKYLALAAALLALAGCNKEPVADGGAITVEATLGAATKVSAAGDAFTAGDQIAVYAWLGGATQMPATRVVDGVVNTFDGTSWTPASMMRWQVTDDPHFFLGVNPAPTAAITDFTAVMYAITGFAATDDLLLATTPAGVKNTGDAVQLAFHHVMARLDVNLRFRNEWATAPAAERVEVFVEAKGGATVNYLTQIVTASGSAGNIALASAKPASGYHLGYSGLQVPQGGVKRIIVVVDGQAYVYESATDIPLTGEKNTTLNLLVGRDKIELEGISLAPWTAEDPLSVGDAELDMLTTPLTFEAKDANTNVSFIVDYVPNPVYYRTHDGQSWSDWSVYTSNTEVLLAKAGDKVQFKGDNAGYNGDGHFNILSDCYVYGNIMSLITSTDFSTCTTLTEELAFSDLFAYTSVMLHPTLELLLPATKLTKFCYHHMFFGCSSLTSAPKLPATTLAESCYYEMFSLSALKEAPELPATMLAKGCYMNMFFQCTNLTVAPILPAQTVPEEGYSNMFSNCSQLSSVTCLATDISAAACVDFMLYHAGSSVTGTKTFVTPSTTPWIMGNEFEGIPTGWTRLDY